MIQPGPRPVNRISQTVSKVMSSMDDRKKGVEIGPVERLRSTEKAAFYRLEHGKEFWIPKSQILVDDGSYIVIPKWLADKTFQSPENKKPGLERPG